MIALFDYAIPYVQGRSDADSLDVATKELGSGCISLHGGPRIAHTDTSPVPWASVKMPPGWRITTDSVSMVIVPRLVVCDPRWPADSVDWPICSYLVYTFVITDEPEAP